MTDAMATHEEVGTTTRKVSYNNTIVWHVPNFFDLPEKVNHRVHSPKFAFMGAEWYLRMYPNEWIRLFLMRDKRATEEFRVTYKLGIRMGDGTDYKTIDCENDFSKIEVCGSFTLLDRATLSNERNQIAPQGTVTFFCTFDGGIGESKEASSQTALTEDLDIPLQNLKELLNGESGDITLNVKSKEFKVHKDILKVRSPVFRSMLSVKMKEESTNSVDITDCDETAFEDFLHFVYCGSVEEFSTAGIFSLYFVADKYDVTELKSICALYIIDNISIDTFFDTINLALKHNDLMILKRATDFFIENSVEIVKSANWLPFQKENPVASSELFLKALQHKAP